MGEDPRLENARLKEQLYKVRQVCELHRKLGEDTAFENRELVRRGEEAKKRLLMFETLYKTLRQNLTDPSVLELCDAALKSLKTAMDALTA
jgi:hypothetical protein